MSRAWSTIPGFIKIGTTGKARGIDGEIRLYPEAQYLSRITDAEFLFIELQGNKVPLRIESLREIQDILVKFEGIDDPGAAEPWSSCNVYLPSDEIPEILTRSAESTLQYDFVSGYAIHDLTLGTIGIISEVREFPQQEMAVIRMDEREILIPLNDAFIREIDPSRQIIHTDLPAGLLEI